MNESHKYLCTTKGYNDCRRCTLHKALDPLSFMETMLKNIRKYHVIEVTTMSTF